MSASKKLTSTLANAAAGGGALNVEDVFSTYLYTGNGGTQVIENGINLGQSNSGGSGYFDGVNDYLSIADDASFNLAGDDFTIETWFYCTGVPSSQTSLNIYSHWSTGPYAGFRLILNSDTSLRFYNVTTSYTTSTGVYNFNEWTHLACVYNSGQISIYVNGEQVLSPTTITVTDAASGTNPQIGTLNVYPSQGEFEGYLSNFRIVKGTAVYTSAFTLPTSELTAVSGTSLLCLQGDEPFTDNSGNSHTLTQNGDVAAKSFGPFDAAEEGAGGLVWVKSRSNTTGNRVFDSVRGDYNFLETNSSGAEVNNTNQISLNSNGFSTGSSVNTNDNGKDYASWTFRKAPKFFDVVTYTGDNTGDRVLNHNVGTVGAVFVKNLTSGDNYSGNWCVHHRSLGTNQSAFLNLNTTAASGSGTGINPVFSSTDTTVTIRGGGIGELNEGGVDYVAYLFAHNDGDGEFGESGDQDIIKCGSYTGNGSSDGPEIDLGFEPQWLLIKRTELSGNNWVLMDVMRGMPNPSGYAWLYPNTSNAEAGETASSQCYPTPTGFKITSAGTNLNANTGTYIYIAIRRPMKTPESGTEVFATAFDAGATDPTYVSGFVADMGIQTNTGGYNKRVSSRLTSGRFLEADNTGAESTSTSNYTWDFMDGWNNQTINSTWLSWMWKRAPGFFDVVCYTGDSSGTRAIPHNLGVAPEMIILKRRNAAGGWLVYHSGADATSPENFYARLDTDSDFSESSLLLNNTAPTDTEFTVSSSSNGSYQYVAYLFASLDGISKVGSYTGDGNASQTINCGFSTGARFVLIKRTGTTSDWYVWDSERGIVAGNDPFLRLNTTDAENTSDSIDPDSSGFIANNDTGIGLNSSGYTYIFYAIA
jgi:hypothetical protein